jgi:MFS family permease
MITMATYGIGMTIGTLLSGYVKDYYTVETIVQWKSVWLAPAGIAAAVLILFVFFFKDNKRTAAHAEPMAMV